MCVYVCDHVFDGCRVFQDGVYGLGGICCWLLHWFWHLLFDLVFQFFNRVIVIVCCLCVFDYRVIQCFLQCVSFYSYFLYLLFVVAYQREIFGARTYATATAATAAAATAATAAATAVDGGCGSGSGSGSSGSCGSSGGSGSR